MYPVSKKYDPIVRLEVLAVALGKGTDTVKRDVYRGAIPQRDAPVNRKGQGWKLSTLRAWNPVVGRRVARIFDALY